MTKDEADTKVDSLNKLPGLSARAVRILPAAQDPIKPGDNGWTWTSQPNSSNLEDL